MWFEDEPSKSWWTCHILVADEVGEWLPMHKRCGTNKEWLLAGFQRERYMNELNTNLNERDLKTMQVWNCIVDNDLKKLIDTISINKIHILYSSLPLKGARLLKQFWHEWTFRKFFRKTWVKIKHTKKSHINL